MLFNTALHPQGAAAEWKGCSVAGLLGCHSIVVAAILYSMQFAIEFYVVACGSMAAVLLITFGYCSPSCVCGLSSQLWQSMGTYINPHSGRLNFTWICCVCSCARRASAGLVRGRARVLQ